MQARKVKKYWWIAVPVLLVVLVYLRYVIPAYVLSSIECGYDVVAEHTTQDKRYVATVFVSNCGAMTSFTSAVNIRLVGQDFSGDKYERVFAARSKVDVRAKWKTNRELEITYPNGIDVYYKLHSIDSLDPIKINFEEKEGSGKEGAVGVVSEGAKRNQSLVGWAVPTKDPSSSDLSVISSPLP